MNRVLNFINGEQTGSSSKSMDIINPATGEIISEVILSDKVDFENCIKSSLQAQIEWSKQTPLKRSRIISRFKELIEKNLVSLAELVCNEHGKTFDDAKVRL